MKSFSKKMTSLILILMLFIIALTPTMVNAANNEVSGEKISGDTLDKVTVRIRPRGSVSALSVKDNGNSGQNVVHIYNIGESSKFYLQKADEDSYYIRFFNNYTKNSSNTNSSNGKYSNKILDLESNDNYKREGSVVHVVTGNENAKNKRWMLYKQPDGTYLIVNKVSNQYWSLKDGDINKNGNKLCQSKKPFYWEIEIVDRDEEKEIDDIKQYDSYNFTYKDDSITSLNWMSKLSDDIYLTDINIPGVHDAATANMDMNISSSCQMLYMDDLLDAGVRYFDLRLGTSIFVDGDTLTLQHGMDRCLDKNDNYLWMDDVLSLSINFLNRNPGETIVFQLLNVNDCHKTIYDYFKKYAEGSDYFYIGDHVPTLGEARGKIVLISRLDLSKVDENVTYDIEKDGFKGQWALKTPDWKLGENNDSALVTSGDDYEVWSQDNYDMSADDKWPWVDGSISGAKNKKYNAEKNGKKAWVVSYTSVSHLLIQTTPLSGARNMNIRVKKALNDNRWGKNEFLGVICSDFSDEQLAQMVYRTNFVEDTNTTNSTIQEKNIWDMLGTAFGEGNIYIICIAALALVGITVFSVVYVKKKKKRENK